MRPSVKIINIFSQPGIKPITSLFQDNHETHYTNKATSSISNINFGLFL